MDFKTLKAESFLLKEGCPDCSKTLIECSCSVAHDPSVTPMVVASAASDVRVRTGSGDEKIRSTEPLPLLGGLIQGKYKLNELIGEGGMARVFKGQHEGLGKTFAVKILRPEVIANKRTLKRFDQEVKASSQLTHANLCQIFDHGVTEDGAPYLVMEHLEGENLRQTIEREGFLDPQRVINLFVELCDAVAHAHYKGVIHRDLKPSNIILTKKGDVETVKIVDFGIAKVLPEQGREGNQQTQTGEIFGSPLYMSPEQCVGKPIDARSDIYSIGCCMYECLTGKPPLQGDNPVQTILQHINDLPKPFDPALGVSSGLEKVVITALRKSVDQRYQSAQDMYRDLILVRDNMPPKGVVDTTKKRSIVDTFKKHRKAGILGLGAVVCVSISLAALMSDSSFRQKLHNSWGDVVSRWTIEPDEPWHLTLLDAKFLAGFWHYDRAYPLYKQALEQAKSARNPLVASYNVLITYGDFLIDCAEKGKGTWGEARKAFAEAVLLASKIDGGSPHHAFQRLGQIDYHLKDYAKAEAEYAQSLAYAAKIWSPESLRDADNVAGQVAIGTTLLEQGNNFIQERKYEEARAAYMRASEVMKAPDDKVYVASALKGIAKTYQEQGNFAEADKAYERAQVFVFKISHPFAHADLVGILKERILVLEKLGHSGQAAALEKQLNAAIASNSSATN